MDLSVDDIQFERLSGFSRAMKKIIVNPLANYLPAGFVKWLLKIGKSELAAANWVNPGGWRSMVMSYKAEPKELADKILIKGGTTPMALRNRRKLGSRLISQLIDGSSADPVHVLCLGAGPGHIISDAMKHATRNSYATLVDLNPDSFEYGKQLAAELGLSDRMRFIQSDARDIDRVLDRPPNIVKMIGICEYLDDEHITMIAGAAAGVMPAGASIVFNSISQAHGTDRFFRRVFGLHMNHRSPEQLQELMARAGFGDFKVFAEPLGVYNVVVGYKK